MRGNPQQFFVMHVDIACSFPLNEMLSAHMKHRGLCTMLGTKVRKRSTLQQRSRQCAKSKSIFIRCRESRLQSTAAWSQSQKQTKSCIMSKSQIRLFLIWYRAVCTSSIRLYLEKWRRRSTERRTTWKKTTIYGLLPTIVCDLSRIFCARFQKIASCTSTSQRTFGDRLRRLGKKWLWRKNKGRAKPC